MLVAFNSFAPELTHVPQVLIEVHGCLVLKMSLLLCVEACGFGPESVMTVTQMIIRIMMARVTGRRRRRQHLSQ
jgi:hypothetical protein